MMGYDGFYLVRISELGLEQVRMGYDGFHGFNWISQMG